jgi:diguanylate cyclase (GGDEF)-like protein
MDAFISLLDARTLAITMTVVYFALAMVMLQTYFTRKTYPGFGSWTMGIVCLAVGVTLSFNQQIFGSGYPLVLSNILSVGALPLFYHGFALYCRLSRPRLRSTFNWALAVAAMVLLAYLILFDGNYSYRAAIYSLVDAIILLRIVIEPFFSRGAVVYPMQRVISVTYLIVSIVLLLRVYDNFMLHSYADILHDPTVKLVVFLSTVSITVLVFGMLTMTTSRVEAELVAAQVQMKTLADTDGLTGLSTRRHFMEQAEGVVKAALRYAHPASLLMLDIDHFKHINDTRGHAAGDRVLQALAGLLARSVREVDVLGRLGGEEFGVLMPETGIASAAMAAERIRRGVEALRPEGLVVTVSIGLAELCGENLETLMIRADDRLYAAKNAGRNLVSTSGEMPAA